MINDDDDTLGHIIQGLTKHFGRLPTEDEVYDFITGDRETRDRIYREGAVR